MINCTRVPIPQGTTLYGTPVDVGPTPAFQGVASNHAAPPRAFNDGDTLDKIDIIAVQEHRFTTPVLYHSVGSYQLQSWT